MHSTARKETEHSITFDSTARRVVEVQDVVQNTPTVKTLFFKDETSAQALAGTFLMVWIPPWGEIPMSVSVPSLSTRYPSITVRKVGQTSSALFELRRGDRFGLRGPYGRGFSIEEVSSGERVLFVGGGTGLAPLARLALLSLEEERSNPLLFDLDFLIAARTKDELIFYPELARVLRNPNRLFVSTDDGSFGFKGLAHEFVNSLSTENEYSLILCCGPELMMKSVHDVAQRKSIRQQQYSLERPMKCAVSLCGSCCVGRYLLCADGPVLDQAQISEVQDEFGKTHRDHSGRIVPIRAGNPKEAFLL